jgi:hypothetical protein
MSYEGQAVPAEASAKAGAPGRIRTCDLLIRSQALYPTELQAQFQQYDYLYQKKLNLTSKIRSY